MAKLGSQLWTNEKGKRFLVLPEEDFLRMSELVEDRGLSRNPSRSHRVGHRGTVHSLCRGETPSRHPVLDARKNTRKA